MDTHPLLKRFNAALERDRRTLDIPGWMLDWQYQANRKDEVGQADMDFDRYSGPQDFAEWFKWDARAGARPMYVPNDRLMPLILRSFSFDQAFVRRHGIDYPEEQLKLIARGNAEDFVFQTLYPTPTRQGLHRVLDFGAGFGRQMNLWSQHEDLRAYVAMDAIPRSYCLQHVYGASAGLRHVDYIDAPDAFELLGNDDAPPSLYHLPTWRTDLLADDFFDGIFCIQVLTELNPNLTLFMLKQFRRVLKPGGMLFLRDHDGRFSPNRMPLNSIIQALGFVLEFRPHIRDLSDMHGVPKIWRKIDDEAVMCLA